MAEELVSFGIQKLWDLLSREHERYQGVDEQVIELKSHLNLLTSFLKDADAKKQQSAMVRNLMEEIKDIVFDTEDIIETYLIREELKKTSEFKKCIRSLAFCIVDHRELASAIGGIDKRISKVIYDLERLGIHQIIADGGYIAQPLHDRQKEMLQTISNNYKSVLVGLDENVKKLVGCLVEKDNVQVVSITGMGGLGKTTLARLLFNHQKVKDEFKGQLAWVRVSHSFTRKSVWQSILRTLRPNEDENKILEMTEETLQSELFQLLETSRSLIVLDDVWRQQDWDRIKPIFPPKKGWKVLLTSRNASIAQDGYTTYMNFELECLTVEDSWTLFQSIAFSKKNASDFKIDEEMKEMGKRMICYCGGLPLAVKLLGGFLAEKYTLQNWKRVFESIRSGIAGGTSFNERNISSVESIRSLVESIRSLSFEELPIYLKQCFLYLAYFPEYYAIDVEKLSYYWAAEGIPKSRSYNGATIRDVADGYIEELVRRNMVIAERDNKTLRFETCHLHDMMREICLFKAKEENFLQIAADSQSPCTSRRFVSQNPNTLNVKGDISNPKLRSLVTVWIDFPRRWMLSGLSFTSLLLLRLLDLSGAEFEGKILPSSIGKLIHLRYLSLKGAMVSRLPSSLRNLKLLIYLNLGVALSSGSIFVPNVFMEMQDLIYLELPTEMLRTTKLELSNLVNLETLKNFSMKNSNIGDLHGMSRLRTLTMIFSDGTSIGTLSASIGGLRHLENLTIKDRGSERMIEERMIEEGIVLDFIHLKVLELIMYMPRFPDEICFPSRLTSLSLRNCRLEEDPMPMLEKLIQLKEVQFWERSFCGRRMVCSGGGFPQLQKLLLFQLEEWEEWIVEEGSMPLLHTLAVMHCPMLKELPDGLRFMVSIKDLTLSMGEEWNGRLSEGGEDYYKVQRIPSVKFTRFQYE